MEATKKTQCKLTTSDCSGIGNHPNFETTKALRVKGLFSEQLSELHSHPGPQAIRRSILEAILGVTPGIGGKAEFQLKLSERLFEILVVPSSQNLSC